LTAGNNLLFADSVITAPSTTESAWGFTTATVESTTSVGGAQRVPIAITSTVPNSGTITNYFGDSGGGLTFYGNNDATDIVTPRISPYAQLLYPVAAGTVSTVTASGIPAGSAGNGDAVTTSFTQTTTVADLETVTVDAGVFANAAKVVQTTSGTLLDTVSKSSIAIANVDTTWLAPGVGVVQDISVTSSNGAVVSTETRSLRSYTVGGVTHGAGAPQTVLSTSGGTSTVFYQSVPAIALPAWTATNGSTVAYIGYETPLTVGVAPVTTVSLQDLAGNALASYQVTSTSSQASVNSAPAVFFDGTNYEIVTEQSSGWYAQRLSPGGAQIDSAPGNLLFAAPSACAGASLWNLAVGSTSVLLLFDCNGNSSGGAIYGAMAPFRPPYSGVTPFVIETGVPYVVVGTQNAAAAFDGTNFLVAYQSGAGTISAVRVSPGGVVLDTTPINVFTASGSGTFLLAGAPAVAFDGTNYLVVWLNNPSGQVFSIGSATSVSSARVSKGGAVIDATPITLSNSATRSRLSPSVVYNGTEYVVTWIDFEAGTTSLLANANGIVGVRMNPLTGALSSGSGYEISYYGPPSVYSAVDNSSRLCQMASGGGVTVACITDVFSVVGITIHAY
jgi:hypothetical protein